MDGCGARERAIAYICDGDGRICSAGQARRGDCWLLLSTSGTMAVQSQSARPVAWIKWGCLACTCELHAGPRRSYAQELQQARKAAC